MLGTAGFKREMAIVATSKPSAPRRDHNDAPLALLSCYPDTRHVHRGKIRRESGRPHNCFFFWFSLRNHGKSKLSKCPTKFDHCICRAYQRHGCGDDDDRETNCFYEKIVSRFVLKILTADIPKVRCLRSDAASPIPVQRHRSIIAVNQREPAVLANSC